MNKLSDIYSSMKPAPMSNTDSHVRAESARFSVFSI